MTQSNEEPDLTEYSTWRGERKPKNRCPICGYTFDEVKAVNVCPTIHYGEQEFSPSDLITDDDDYAWCI